MQSSIRLQFLGTGSQRSTLFRATQSIAMIIQNGTSIGEWLFDCGDLTTHQILSSRKESTEQNRNNPFTLKHSRISKIFITHLHGDHIYGLPALLTSIGLSRVHKTAQSTLPIDIYGPPGLAHYLKTVFQISDTKCNFPCIIHELYSNPSDPRLDMMSPQKVQYEDKRMIVDPLFPSKEGYWDLFTDSFGTVRAGSLDHCIDCFGFVYSSLFGRTLNRDRITQLLDSQAVWLKSQGISERDVIRMLSSNQSVVINGKRIEPSSVFQYSATQKKIAILGDTSNAGAMKPLIQGADLLVHEATVAPLQSEMKNKSEKEFEDAIRRSGHSTIRMATSFAKECGIKRLVLTHISTRYSKRDVKEMEAMAMKMFESGQVVIANDFLKLTVYNVC